MPHCFVSAPISSLPPPPPLPPLQVSLPRLSLKWPNDVYAASQKVAGVLCTSTYWDKRFSVVVGE